MINDINFHPLSSDVPLPTRLNCPFYYQPHPLAVEATKEVQQKILSMVEWGSEPELGKMFGVLVVVDNESVATGVKGSLGYLMAYSGQIGGREDWTEWVPAVYNYLQPDGYFVTHENEISRINRDIEDLQKSPRYAVACARLARVEAEGRQRIDSYRDFMAKAKAKRDILRAKDFSSQELIRESQFQKAELKRIKLSVNYEIMAARKETDCYANKITELKRKRKAMSDSLQQWLFSQFFFMNAKGEKQNLVDIFKTTSLSERIGTVNAIPSGSGGCCAPKLLQYAYLKGYTPVTMAEFWWGKSPVGEIRHHLHYYPACQGKCKPILDFMLQGLDVDPNPLLEGDLSNTPLHLIILYRDEYLVAIDKPAGILSTPGKTNKQSALEMMMLQQPDLGQLYPVHRLDMQTSGILLFARSVEMQRTMQQLFAMREVQKTYTAVLERNIDIPLRGTIDLPVAKDFVNRPRMKVDAAGLPSVTDYQVVSCAGAAQTRLHLYPHTGRTHQLRIHCASPHGLNCPIVGDDLYGTHAERLLLHAEHISFVHPVTKQQTDIHSECPF